MPTTTTAQSKIAELQAQIELLKDTATKELREKRVALAQELHVVDAELARLTGKAPEKGTRRKPTGGRSISLEELKGLLAAAPGKTLNVRKEGFNPRTVRLLAKANAGVLKMGGKGPWPEITLVK
jgi:hypothetical protein